MKVTCGVVTGLVIFAVECTVGKVVVLDTAVDVVFDVEGLAG